MGATRTEASGRRRVATASGPRRVILADTSVWIDHLRGGETRLRDELAQRAVLVHPFVIGEIACGRLGRRAVVLELLARLPFAPVATDAEALALIERRALMGRGIGWVDVHLLAAALMAGAILWTRDRRLHAIAAELGIAA